MSRIAYVNGRYVPMAHASVNIEDRGYQFADGVYEVVLVDNGGMVDEALHLDRLERSLREIRIAMPVNRSALQKILRQVAKRNRVRNGLIYMQVSRGVARREHFFPTHDVAPALVITARATKPFPTNLDGWAIAALTQPDLRWARCDIKSTGLLANVLAKQAAREAGAGEAILINAEGQVTEGGSTNVWMVDSQGRLRTRALDNAILPGCTRAALIALINDAGLSHQEAGFTHDELKDAREIFVTSATSFVKPVTKLDGVIVGNGKPGPVTRQLFDLFSRHVLGNRHNQAAH
jgi:D-alanine transaminase